MMPIPETSSTNAPYNSESAAEAVAEGSAGQEEIQRSAYGVEVDKRSTKSIPLSNPVPTADGNGLLHVTLR